MVVAALGDLRAQSKGLDVIQTQVDELLPLKNKLDLLSKRVQVIRKAITDILNSDEDMIMMHLSPTPPDRSPSEKPSIDISAAIVAEIADMERREGEHDKEIQIQKLREWWRNRQEVVTSEEGGGEEKEEVAAFERLVSLLKADSDHGEYMGSGRRGSKAHIRPEQPSSSGFHSKLFSKSHSEPFSSPSIHAASHRPEKDIDTMHLEMLFENYLNEIEWIASELDGLQDNITNTEENVVLQLDLLRNRILRFELFLSISSFVVTCGALVTGLFGMNLVNHFETNGGMFYAVFSLTMLAMFWSFISFKRYGRRENLF